jgi:hypothetical protein
LRAPTKVLTAKQYVVAYRRVEEILPAGGGRLGVCVAVYTNGKGELAGKRVEG